MVGEHGGGPQHPIETQQANPPLLFDAEAVGPLGIRKLHHERVLTPRQDPLLMQRVDRSFAGCPARELDKGAARMDAFGLEDVDLLDLSKGRKHRRHVGLRSRLGDLADKQLTRSDRRFGRAAAHEAPGVGKVDYQGASAPALQSRGAIDGARCALGIGPATELDHGATAGLTLWRAHQSELLDLAKRAKERGQVLLRLVCRDLAHKPAKNGYKGWVTLGATEDTTRRALANSGKKNLQARHARDSLPEKEQKGIEY